jgi:hypothetical protein
MSTLTQRERPATPDDWREDEVPASEPFDRGYWLSHSEGYRVDFPGGAHGFVEEVRHAFDPDRAPLLAIRVGRLGRRVVVVPTDEVAFIVPRAERIWLRSPLEIARTEAAPRRAHT